MKQACTTAHRTETRGSAEPSAQTMRGEPALCHSSRQQNHKGVWGKWTVEPWGRCTFVAVSAFHLLWMCVPWLSHLFLFCCLEACLELLLRGDSNLCCQDTNSPIQRVSPNMNQQWWHNPSERASASSAKSTGASGSGQNQPESQEKCAVPLSTKWRSVKTGDQWNTARLAIQVPGTVESYLHSL